MGEYADEAVDRLLGHHGYLSRRRRQPSIEEQRAWREAEHEQRLKDLVDELPDLADDE